MDTRTLTEVSLAVHEGRMSFPEVMRHLLAAGIESYRVDFAARRKTFLSVDGEAVELPLDFESLPAMAAELDVPALRANLLDSQQQGQKYRDFVRRAMEGGVLGYIAFLRGQRVLYWGRCGNQHIEWFPGTMQAREQAP